MPKSLKDYADQELSDLLIGNLKSVPQLQAQLFQTQQNIVVIEAEQKRRKTPVNAVADTTITPEDEKT